LNIEEKEGGKMVPQVTGTQTMVVSPHSLASAAGSRILQQGGNAFDAAVAVSACLAVVYPHMTGLGGDSFWLTYSTEERKVRAYNASGRSGSLITAACFAGEAGTPKRHYRAGYGGRLGCHITGIWLEDAGRSA